jgi:magnesium-transporting ATPase (P-type)
MQLTNEQFQQATSKIEKITNQMTETYIRYYETEIKFIQEKAKLSLWIIGLSIGMELFVLNKIEVGVLSNFFNAILFYSIGAIFMINAFIGLLLRLKQTRLLNHLLSIQTQYDYQCTNILLNLEPDCKLLSELI